MIHHIQHPESPIPPPETSPERFLREIQERARHEHHIELDPAALPREDLIIYAAIQNGALSRERLVFYGNRVREDLRGGNEEEKTNRKKFFEFILPEAETLLLRKHAFDKERARDAKKRKEYTADDYARETLADFTAMERMGAVTSGHFLEKDFSIDSLTEEDLAMWLKTLDRRVTREEYQTYIRSLTDKKGLERDDVPLPRRIFLRAIRNFTTPLFTE